MDTRYRTSSPFINESGNELHHCHDKKYYFGEYEKTRENKKERSDSIAHESGRVNSCIAYFSVFAKTGKNAQVKAAAEAAIAADKELLRELKAHKPFVL